jgi:predicted RNA binding protein YcfA (HicA-like mRNA interferase family)
MAKITNISLKKLRKFLLAQGFSQSHDNGGHEIWKKTGLLRPVVLQTHIDPVPARIVDQIRRHCSLSSKAFCDIIDTL